MGKFINLVGKTFNRLTVIEKRRRFMSNNIIWLCKCSCGNFTKVRTAQLKSGHTKSCGCYQKEKVTKHNQAGRKNGKTQEYQAWQAMKNRCYNKKNKYYHCYGGRNIRVWSDWINSFENFFHDVGKKPSSKHQLDRINNNGHYTPLNVKWSTPTQNSNNKRNTVLIKFNNLTLSIPQWALLLDINKNTLRKRIHQLHWSIEKAFITPPKNLQPRKPEF